MARVRMGCIALARLIQDHLGIETIIHFTTRDRNLMALQSELLGAHALGIRNILALTGDPVRAGAYPNTTGVWDVDSVGLIRRAARHERAAIDAGGAALGMSAHFHYGAAFNLNMRDELIDVEQELHPAQTDRCRDEAMAKRRLIEDEQPHRDRTRDAPSPTEVGRRRPIYHDAADLFDGAAGAFQCGLWADARADDIGNGSAA